MTTISNGQTSIVSSGQTVRRLIVLSGGIVDVESGGTVDASTVSGGILNIYSGGTASGTVINSFFPGGEDVYGTAIGTRIDLGVQNVFSGGTAIGTTLAPISGFAEQQLLAGGTASGTIVGSGGSQVIEGGTAIGTIVGSGGTELVLGGSINTSSGFQSFVGTASNTTISGGTLELAYGGSLGSGPITFAGQGGTLRIDVASSLPTNVISGFGLGDRIDLTNVSFASGGTAQVTAGNVLQIVENGNTYDFQLDQNFAGQTFHLSPDANAGPYGPGTLVMLAQIATVSSGHTVSKTPIALGQVQNVFGTAISATVSSGGEQDVFGRTTGTRLLGGAQVVYGTATGTTVSSGGYDYVASGGTASGTVINSFFPGGEDVYGTAIGTRIDLGVQNVFSGGTAIGTTLAPISGFAEQQLLAGGTASGTIVGSGGSQVIEGGTAIGTIVGSGGTELVLGGSINTSSGFQSFVGTASNTTISGGTLELAYGGSLGSGPITFAGQGGTLRIDVASSLPTNVISGFGLGDRIDLTNVSFASGGTAQVTAGNVLQIVENGNTYDFQLDQNFAGQTFHLSPDANAGPYGPGTLVMLAQIATVSSGHTVSKTPIALGQVQNVFGTAISATVSSGGEQDVFGRTTGTRLLGGAQVVYGTATGTTVSSGGYDYVASGGTASGTVINSFFLGGEDVYGTAIGTRIDLGVQNVFSGGTAIGTTLAPISGFAEQQLLAGGTASGTIVGSGGSQVIEGGTAIGTIVGSGGTELVLGGSINTSSGFQSFVGTASNTTISGGTLELAYGGSLGSGPITFAGQGGTLRIDVASSLPTNVISGFGLGDRIDLTNVSFASGGTAQVTAGNVLQIVENGNTYDFQLDQNFAGQTFLLSLDGSGGTDVSLNADTMPPTAGAPVALPDVGIVQKGMTLNVSAANGVLANDSDPDGDALAVSAVNGVGTNVGVPIDGEYGTLTLNTDGSYIYIASNNTTIINNQVQDQFSYTITDGHGGTATSVFDVEVLSQQAVKAGYSAASSPLATYAQEDTKTGATDYYDQKGGTLIETNNSNGSLSWRNNNPGNILYSPTSPVENLSIGKYSSPNGYTYFIFPDYATGVEAAVQLLKDLYSQLTINEALVKWVGPKITANALKNYENQVDQAVGASSSTLVGSLTDSQLNTMVIKGIQPAPAEGWTVGTETVYGNVSGTVNSSVSQLVQAMASFGGGASGLSASTPVLPLETTVQNLLAAPPHHG